MSRELIVINNYHCKQDSKTRVDKNLFRIISQPIMYVILRRATFWKNSLFPQTNKNVSISYQENLDENKLILTANH